MLAAPSATCRVPRCVPLRIARGAISSKPRSGAQLSVSRAKRSSSGAEPSAKGGFSQKYLQFEKEYPWVTVTSVSQYPLMPFPVLGQGNLLLQALVSRLLLADRLVPRFNEHALYLYIYEILAAIVALDLGKVSLCPLVPGTEAEDKVEEDDMEDALNLESTDHEEQPALGDSIASSWPAPNMRALIQHNLKGQRSGRFGDCHGLFIS